jgi:uncharacterized protein (TIGR00255 family)
MTGFGAAEGVVGRARVSVEVRTVNHRFFNPSIKLPSVYARWEGDLRETLRRRIARGHVTLGVHVNRDADAGAVAVDEARFAAYVARLAELKARYALGGELDVGTVLQLPAVVVTESEGASLETDGAQLVAVVEAAVTALSSMREAEGARLAAFICQRLTLVEQAVDRIAARSPERVVAARDRLREAVRALTDGVAIDEQRLAQEIAILAERLDVAEELDRFRSHIAACRATLDDGAPDGVGKRLGFLAQELVREANTTGSKANDGPIVQDVVLIKEELERIREQVDNLE